MSNNCDIACEIYVPMEPSHKLGIVEAYIKGTCITDSGISEKSVQNKNKSVRTCSNINKIISSQKCLKYKHLRWNIFSTLIDV